MIPGDRDMWLKVLKILEDGSEKKRKEIIEKLYAHFKDHPDFRMNDEERNKCYEKSGTNIFNFRVVWAIWHLKIAKLLEPVSKGTVRITEKGKKFLNSIPPNITDSEFSELIDKALDHQEFIRNMRSKRRKGKKS